MIATIARFNMPNRYLVNRSLEERHIIDGRIVVDNLYSFNNTGRISGMTSYNTTSDSNNKQDKFIAGFSYDNGFLSVIDSFDSYYKEGITYNIRITPYSLAGNIDLITDRNTVNYSVYSAENVMEITDGYDRVDILFDQYGRMKRLKSTIGETTEFSYINAYYLVNKIKIISPYDNPSITYYKYDRFGVPLSSATVYNGHVKGTQYVLI